MKKSISKISSMILALVLIISALSVPSILGTAATSEETVADKTGSYEFEFDDATDLAKAYSYKPSNSLPEITEDVDKKVLKMNSTDGKVFARLPFKLEAGKKYNYSISYRVASKNDTAEGKTTVLKLISSGKNDTMSSLVSAGSTRNLSVLLSWAELNVKAEYTPLSGSFEATDSNVTGEYQYLTIHYETNKNFEQILYIDKISIYEALDDVTGNYTFDFENPSELQAAFSWVSADRPVITEDNGKQVISMTSLKNSPSSIQLPYVLKSNKRYYYSIDYKVFSKELNNATDISTLLQFYSTSKKSGSTSASFGGNSLHNVIKWNTLNVGNTYETVDGTFTTADKVTDQLKYLVLSYKTDDGGKKVANQVIYIDSITIRECNNAISFNAGDGVSVGSITDLGIGDVVALPLPEKEGYYFDGWYTDAEYNNSVGLTYAVTEDGNIMLFGKLVEKTTPVAPETPKMVSHTQYSVTIEEKAGYEYSIDNGKTWQLSPEFSGLFTGVYSFTQRVAATKTTNASPASDAFIYTIAAYGDANADGEINASDLKAIRTALLNSENKQAEDGFNANGDDAFDIRDLVCANEIIAAQATTTAKTLINNVDITKFALVNNITNENGTKIATAFTNAVKGRTNSDFAESSEKTIEISLDDMLEDESYKIYVKNGNMYITAKAEDILLKAVNALCDRIKNYDVGKTLNLQEGYTFSGSYPTLKYIAFTFDDGPTSDTVEGAPIKTYVDTLSNYGGSGTLFVIGAKINSNGLGQLNYAHEKGFEIGNHTMNHTNFVTTGADEEKIKSEITGVNNLLSGYTARWLRPGELAVNKTVYKVAKELYMPIIGSSDTAKDWIDTSTSATIKNDVIDGAYDGQIVLIHADKQKSADCFGEIASTLYKKGYRFVTVSELLATKGSGIIPAGARINGIIGSEYQTN